MSTTYVISCRGIKPENLEAVRARIGTRVYAKAAGPVPFEKVFNREERFETPTYAERVEEAAELIDNAATDVDDLATEMQDWYDNLPEAFQNGDKGEQLQSAHDGLEELHDELTVDRELNALAKKLEALFPAPEDDARTKRIDLSLRLDKYGMKQRGINFNITTLTKALKGIDVTIRKDDLGGSRSDRLAEAASQVEEAGEILSALAVDLEAEKRDALTEDIESLKEMADNLSGLDFGSVDFPGMY